MIHPVPPASPPPGPLQPRKPGAGFPRPPSSLALAVLLLLLLSHPGEAQEGRAWRVGLTLGGSSFLGLVVEYRRDATAVEVGAGTWSLRDLSLTLTGKYYAGDAAVSPFAGLGFWAVTAFPSGTEPGERQGGALVLRAPLGLDGALADRHALGLEVILNRAVAVRRTDPEDATPPARRVIPLPGFYYRYGRTP